MVLQLLARMRLSTNARHTKHQLTILAAGVTSQVKKVKASNTRYRALGPELIPVYRQSACR